MRTNAILFTIFSLFLICGGVIGFVKAGSITSLITSSTFAAIILTCSFFIFKGKIVAEYLAFFALLSLDAVFWWRYYASGNFFPAGAMLTFSTLIALFVYLNLKKRIKESL